MRCRKVRSFLSAYCNDELTGRKRLAVREHLSTCCDCRREEAFYGSMKTAAGELPGLSVSADFNPQLLNRIARERFAETRTRAFLPRRAPIVSWSRAVPILAIVPVLALAAAYWFVGGGTTGPTEVGGSRGGRGPGPVRPRSRPWARGRDDRGSRRVGASDEPEERSAGARRGVCPRPGPKDARSGR